MQPSHLKEIDESIFSVLDAIRSRPAIYLGKASIIRLQAFLSGLGCGLGKLGAMMKDQTKFDRFHDWVAKEFSYSASTSGWCHMILEKAGNDRDAFDLFFELADRFRSELSK